MRPLYLRARFPLGVYIGHRSDKKQDLAPSPGRLHSALLHSAAQGSLGNNGEPTAESIAALEWLENHPPTGLLQPEYRLTNKSPETIVYRKSGTFDTSKGRIQYRSKDQKLAGGISVAEGFGYYWDEVPEDIANRITALSEDVGCLGEAHSMVVLEEMEFEPNLWRADNATIFTRDKQEREIAIPGRTRALMNAHKQRFKAKVNHKFVKTAKPASEIPSSSGLDSLYYAAAERTLSSDSPWTSAWFFSLDKPVPRHLRVELSVSIHRKLIAINGNNVSPIITGKYGSQNIAKLPNRLAIQYLPEKWSLTIGLEGNNMVLFIPQGTDEGDLKQIQEAKKIWNVYVRGFGRIKIHFTGESRSADKFWPEPKRGYTRLWKPLSPVIPDTRRVDLPGVNWTLGDTGLLSLGYIWRNRFSSKKRGQHKYVDIRDQVTAAGAAVHAAHSLPVRASDYVHRIPEHVVAQPYTAVFDLHGLSDDRTAVMVGQSRHLGGGLLAPFDISGDFTEAKEQSDDSDR